MASSHYLPRSTSGREETPGLEVAEGGADVVRSGFYRVDQVVVVIRRTRKYLQLRDEGVGDTVCQHLMEAFKLEAGKVFKG
jgi:hypothetical protein